jgi:hypothetical protein
MQTGQNFIAFRIRSNAAWIDLYAELIWSPRLTNPVRETRAERRSRNLMIGTNKERHRTLEVADPNLVRAGVEIQGTFFVDLALTVRRGKDFDTDFRGANEDGRLRLIADFKPTWSEPSDIDGLDAVSSRERALRNDEALGKQVGQKIAHGKLSAPVAESWRGSHEDMSVSIGLYSIRQVRQPRICTEFSPASEVERSLRLEVRELDCDRHVGKIRQKWKNA